MVASTKQCRRTGTSPKKKKQTNSGNVNMKSTYEMWSKILFLVLLAPIDKTLANCSCVNNDQFPLEYVYEFAHTDKDPERQMAYFREDVSLGASHLNFHYSIPFWTTPRNILMDRIGELSIYFHQQMVARYDAERFSMGFPRVVPFKNFLDPIPEGYIPNYPPLSTKYVYHGRSANMTLADVPGKMLVSNLILWRQRLQDAVNQGYIKHHNGTELPIVNEAGVDLLARVSQSTANAPNHKYYGCYHAYFHLLAGRISDPREKYYKYFDIIMDFMVGVMDPLFFRYHRHYVDLFVSLKEKLPKYTKRELTWNDVKLNSISVLGDVTNKPDQLTTFTQQWKPLMKHGFDLISDIPVKVLFHILQHEEFTYKIEVNNLSHRTVTATTRLFLAPVYDDKGQALPLQEQRHLFIELDKFKVSLKRGRQTIRRHSTKSTVTVPLEKSTNIFATAPITESGLPDIGKNPCFWPHHLMNQSNITGDMDVTEEFNSPLTVQLAHSQCGWPHHLLLPRGKKEGMPFILFAMLTDWQEDKVRSFPEQDFVPASSYCSIFNDTYPDKRAMGFPFDRTVPDGSSIKSFLHPNMATIEIKIYHSNQVVPLGGTFGQPNKTKSFLRRTDFNSG